MEKIKLVNKSGKVIERTKSDYESNLSSWDKKGFSIYEKKVDKPATEPAKKKAKKKKSK
jgi:hypothetical protein